MTNFEKYKEELLSFIRNYRCTPARIDGTFVPCDSHLCKNCEYNYTGNCFIALIEWLYKDDGEVDIDTMSCHSCKYINKTIDENPCSECRRGYEDKFEPKPKKTRQDEFLEMYPNAIRDKSTDVIMVCPKDISGEIPYNFGRKCDISCVECCQDYWFQEVEE